MANPYFELTCEFRPEVCALAERALPEIVALPG
jgi:hypothetical protein